MEKNIKKKRISSKVKKRIIIVLSTILAVIIVAFIGVNLYMDSILNRMNQKDSFKESEVYAYESDRDIDNIALLGVDQSEDGTQQRTDVVKIISLNFEDKNMTISSIQRDNIMYQPMEDRYEKLNHAYWYDGVQGTLSTLNYNLDLDITQYVKFDFDSVVEIVDIVGGVDIDLTEAEAASLGLYSGVQHLDGQQALAYSRIRNIDSDYGRMNRQNNVINAMLSSIRNQSVLDILDTVNEVMPYIETNVSNGKIKNYITSFLTFDKTLNQYQFPSNGSESVLTSITVNGYGPNYILKDFVGEVELLHKDIYGEGYSPSENVKKVAEETLQLAGY
ncbi:MULTISPECIES: LCP family protein [unclassified Breznakia]|uniref:LCP family protein n=1 Tax=unclassified Breznakia TaxID=2623764 RepID=UPI0024752EF2|nr:MULTISPECIES: LCP family protein [unclassified Breznakia]MDH6366298.1 LCP family protein required for cell wall assembly [Breznakia sp. PH1-1]MDH6403391.1 LCP family protein required for cell wall assembly [Breznakia sp. PF1-11]MDH6411100.1 LCP family protein required for cell wall assembly [Breznakia sp. PFB1-11]MDH6413464.1 LCP family protein required for cell wall assembly [Breznakia sp. PFB1-14]MDH6416747.1 LCP family protein required for cell wall assembly [Breznakia sp. PFB1-4]